MNNLLNTSQGKNNELRQIYKSSLRASYFNHFQANKFTNKSRIQVQERGEEEDVDENTFRIMKNFKSPETDFIVVKREGEVNLETGGGFFSCFGRKEYTASLKNLVLKIHTGGKLKYYFDFDVINAKISDKNDRFEIRIQTINKDFSFYPVQKKQTPEWVAAINQSIKNSDGKRFQNQEICKVPEFYKKPYISHHQFAKKANTGDIILFRSQHSAARLQQVFLNSQYDHVAVVLRNKKNELFLYESSSFEGVGFTEWKHMIKYEWYKSTEKIAWRKLNFKLESNHIDTIEAFVVKTLGKGFDISLDKIFSFQSKIQRDKETEANKTYFCSELVARMYKQIGLLDQNVSCTQYYPVTFSDKGSLKLQDPRASLDPEYVIAF